MKKKILSCILTMAMLVGMFAPIPMFEVTAAAADSGYGMALVGVEATDGKEDLHMNLYYKGSQIKKAQSIFIVIDPDQLKLVSLDDGSDITLQSDLSTALTIKTTGKNPKNHILSYSDMTNVYGMQTDAGIQLMLQQIMNSPIDCNKGYDETNPTDTTDVYLEFGLKFVGTTTIDSLNENSIRLATKEEAQAAGQGSVAQVNIDGSAFKYGYVDGTEDNLSVVIKYPNSENGSSGDDTELTDITVALNATTIEVPTKDHTASTTATATPNTGAELGTVAWSIDPAYDGVSINDSGVITVQPSAAAGTVTVKATSGSVSGTADLTLTKATAEAATVTVNPTEATVTLNADGSAPAAIDVAVTAEDQYGEAIATPSVTPSGLPTGASWANDKITFTGDLRSAAETTVTFTVDSASADFKLTVNKVAAPAAPSVTGVNPSGKNQTDGKITGVDTTMEYKGGTVTDWTAVTSGTEITGLSKGTYEVRVKGTVFVEAGQTATVTLTEPGVSATPVVTIIVNPDGGKVWEGDKVTLTANVTGNNGGTLTYQWAKDGTDMTGETNATLEIASFAAADEGVYTVTVVNTEDGKEAADAVTSDGVTLAKKEKATVTVEAKDSVKKSLSSWKIADLVTVSIPEGAEEVTVADIVNGKATLTGDTWKDTKGVVSAVFYKAEKADDGSTTYTKISDAKDLVAGTYYVDYAVKAVDDQKTYQIAAKAAKGAVPTDATLGDFIKVELTKSSAGSIGGGSGSSSGLSRYLVTYDAGDHGKIFSGSSTERVVEGDKPANVPTIKADDGYKFIGWTLNGKSVKPGSTVIESSTKFVAEYTITKDLNAYIEGVSDETFAPNANATRGEIATMMARLYKDYDKDAGYTSDAPDVAKGAWYANAVNFAIKQGVMNGYKEDGTFRPTANITRGEFAAMLARYLGVDEVSDNRFTDMSGNWAAGYVNALAAAGIVDGFEDGTFKAGDLLTRAQAVKMIDLAINMSYDSSADYEKTFTDVAKDAWYYVYVMPAANLDIAPYQK